MRLKSLKLSDLTRFHNQTVEVPFDDMPDGLIAICGANGEGKTTILEASCPGVIYRTMPSRSPKSLAHCARSREAGIELEFAHGVHDYRAKLLVDNVSGKQEAHIWRDGEPLVDGKVRDYDTAVQGILGTEEEVLASVFAVQGGEGSFVNLSASERRKLFRKLLGIERMDVLAKDANDQAKRYAQEYELALANIRGRSDIEEDLNRLSKTVEDHENRRYELVTRQREEEKQYREAQDKYRAFEVELRESHSAAMAQHEILKAAKEKIDLIHARRTSLTKAVDREMVTKAHIERSLESVGSRLSQQIEGYPDNVKSLNRAAAEKSVIELAEQLVVARTSRSSEHKRDKLGALAEELELQCGAETPCEKEMKEGCPLAIHANEAAAKLERVQAELGGFDDTVCATDEDILALEEKLAVLRDDLRDNASYLKRLSSADERKGKDLIERKRLSSQLVEIDVTLAGLREELRGVGDAVSVDEENARYKAVKSRYELVLEQRNLVVKEGEGHASKVQATTATLKGCEKELIAANQELAAFMKEEELLNAAEERGKIAQMEAAAWKAVAVGLGSHGVQALEIDAAGPRVSTLANALLEASHGERFQVHVVTSRAKASGKGFTESFSVEVVDNLRGNSSDVANLSGGEKVVVDEAIRLAISLFRNEELAQPWKTLWRDETTGALDADNAAKYIAMLRKAQELGGFEQVVFIAHQQDVIAAADARVELRGGVASIS